jgi:hypothetical protein
MFSAHEIQKREGGWGGAASNIDRGFWNCNESGWKEGEWHSFGNVISSIVVDWFTAVFVFVGGVGVTAPFHMHQKQCDWERCDIHYTGSLNKNRFVCSRFGADSMRITGCRRLQDWVALKVLCTIVMATDEWGWIRWWYAQRVVRACVPFASHVADLRMCVNPWRNNSLNIPRSTFVSVTM